MTAAQRRSEPPPDEGTVQERAKTQRDRRLLRAVTALFAAGAVGYGLMLGIRAALELWGLPVEVAVWLANLTSQEIPEPDLGTGPPGPMRRHEFKQAAAWRALYIVGAAQRLAAAKDVQHAEDVEEGYFERQVAAEARRDRAAALSDVAAKLLNDRTEEQTDKVPLLGWRAVIDDKTTPACRWANGMNYRADRIPVIGLPGAVHPRCFPAGTQVVSPAVRGTTTRWYSGELVEFSTLSGDFLAVTPNHPILTSEGWVAAGLLHEGSDVVRTSFPEALCALVDPDDYQRPALIEDVVRAFNERRGVLTRSVPVAPEDFHGDGATSEVAVVGANGVLVDGVEPAQAQPRGVEQFVGVEGDFPVAQLGSTALFVECHGGASDGGVGGGGVAPVLFGAALGHHQPIGLGDGTTLNPGPDQDVLDALAGEIYCAGDLGLAHTAEVEPGDLVDVGFGAPGAFSPGAGEARSLGAGAQGATFDERVAQNTPGDAESLRDHAVAEIRGLIELDRVVKVSRREWSGHVYNLESSGGWYISSNIVVHNCRCTPGPPFPGAPLIPSA